MIFTNNFGVNLFECVSVPVNQIGQVILRQGIQVVSHHDLSTILVLSLGSRNVQQFLSHQEMIVKPIFDCLIVWRDHFCHFPCIRL